MSVGTKVSKGRMEGKEPAGVLGLQYLLARRLVLDKVKSAIGLGQVKMCVSGAAPIAVEVLEFFASLDILINEVYGLSESTGGISFNRYGMVRFGSVGTPLPSVEAKIAADGEVLAKGPNLFLGYYRNEAATEETFSDGWLLSGDIGKQDAEGYLYIVDRKKHIIITAGGKNITPANIEYEIKARDPIISHVHAHGDRRPYVTALMTVDQMIAVDYSLERGILDSPEAAEKLKQTLRRNPNDRPDELNEMMKRVTNDPGLRQRIAAAVQVANEKLSRVEQVKRVYLLDRELSVEEDEITPTMKVKRKKVEKKYAPVFDRLYEEESFGIVVMEK
jgi:long-chain acyl-CoA synthetase